MNQNSNVSPIITPDKPKLILPGQPEPSPQQQDPLQGINVQQVVELFAMACEHICTAEGDDTVELETKKPDGSKVYIVYSRGEAAITIKKWVNKGKKRVAKTSHEGGK